MMVENMKTMFKTLVLALLVFLTAACSVLQQVVEKPTVHVKEVKYHSVSFKEGRLDSNMQISNPNRFSLPLRNLTYHLKLNDREFANSALSFDKNIPAQGTMELHVPIQFRYAELLNGIASFLQRQNVKFQIAGELDFGVVKIPFSKSGEFALKR